MGRGNVAKVLVALAAIVVGSTPATAGAGEEPVDPVRVVVFGDSVAHSFGCALGDDPTGSDYWECPAVPGYETDNEYLGACSITGGFVLGYDGGLYTSPCNPKQTWPDQLAELDPDVVILVSTGYEITDRWVKRPTGTTHQWTPSPTHQWARPNRPEAAERYAKKLRQAVDIVLASGATLIVSNMPYVNSVAPAAGVFYEPYGSQPPAGWVKPNKGAPYRSSRDKVLELNAAIADVVAEYQAQDAPVHLFDFAGFFNSGDTFNRYVCVPAPPEVPVSPALPCDRHAPGAVLARSRDRLHLTKEGVTQVLKPVLLTYLEGLLEPEPDPEPEPEPEPESVPTSPRAANPEGPTLPELVPPESR